MTQTTGLQNRNSLFVDTDVSKIFVWNNRYDKATFTNSSGGELVLTAGMLIGRVSADSKIAILKSASTDGSQIPVGILAEGITLQDTESADLNFCVAGDVDENKVIYDGTDTKATTITFETNLDRTYQDLIASIGIRVVESTELTGHDNA